MNNYNRVKDTTSDSLISMFEARGEGIFFGFDGVAVECVFPDFKRAFVAELVAALIFEVQDIFFKSLRFAMRACGRRHGIGPLGRSVAFCGAINLIGLPAINFIAIFCCINRHASINRFFVGFSHAFVDGLRFVDVFKVAVAKVAHADFDALCACGFFNGKTFSSRLSFGAACGGSGC